MNKFGKLNFFDLRAPLSHKSFIDVDSSLLSDYC